MALLTTRIKTVWLGFIPMLHFLLAACTTQDLQVTKAGNVRSGIQSNSFSYGTNILTALVGKSAQFALQSQPVSSFIEVTVTPELPAGLTIGKDAVIKGTPTATSALTTYTIFAKSADAEFLTKISMRVLEDATGFSYSLSDHRFVTGQDIEIKPDQMPIEVAFESISVSPDLPSGLKISDNGMILGKPVNAAQNAKYLVTAIAGKKQYSANVSFYIVNIGSGLTYSTTASKLVVGQQSTISPDTVPPASLDKISVYPSLPSGLTISNSGVISGTPTSGLAETTYTVTGLAGTTEYSANVKIRIVTIGSGFSYSGLGYHLLTNEPIDIQPVQMPVAQFDSINVTPSLPTGLTLDNYGHIIGTTTSSSVLTNFSVVATFGLLEYQGTFSLRVSTPQAVAATVMPLTEISVGVSWSASNEASLNGYRIQVTLSDGSKTNFFEPASSIQKNISGLPPGSKFSVRVRALLDPPGIGDSTDLVSAGWTPFGAINSDTASMVPQEPWKPSGLEALAISENFSIVWSFFWNPGFTPAWKGIPTKDQKGDFYFNTSLNRAYQNTNGILWGDTGSRDDVTQIWTNGVDKFIVGTWRGRLHLWDHLPNTPETIAHTREIGLGSSNRSTFSGTASACFDASVNKLYVTNGGRNRVLVFNGWPTTSNPDAEYVLGQPDFDTFSAATSATGMSNPWSLSCDGGILVVGDLGNARVLVWTKAITANNQAADFIYGQSNATSSGANGAGGVNAGGVAHPRSVLLVPRSTGGYALVVADTTQNRVVEWDRIPATPASQSFPGTFDRVYGQPNRSSVTANADGQSMASMAGPVALSVERDKNGTPKVDTFWVADGAYWTAHNSRILKFQRGNSTAVDLWGDANGATSLSGWTFPKDRVGFWWAHYVNYSRIGCLGSQGIYNMGGYVWKNAPANGVTSSDFTDGNRCHTATAGGKTWIANGASIWGLDLASGLDAPSPLTGSPVLLGRKNADGTDNTGIADSHEFKISGVGDMATSGNSLLVLDSNRIVIWNTSGISNHAIVTTVIGQSTKTTNDANQGGLSAKTFNGPATMVIHQGKIIVADRGNNRILIWNSIPTSDYQPADVILGQALATTTTTGTGLGELNTPTSAAVIGGKLVVTDRGNHRVLVWDSIPTVSGQVASRSVDLRDYRFSLPSWYNPNALSPVWIRAFQDRVYIEQYGRVLVIPDIF